jgi:hypothetical protein
MIFDSAAAQSSRVSGARQVPFSLATLDRSDAGVRYASNALIWDAGPLVGKFSVGVPEFQTAFDGSARDGKIPHERKSISVLPLSKCARTHSTGWGEIVIWAGSVSARGRPPGTENFRQPFPSGGHHIQGCPQSLKMTPALRPIAPANFALLSAMEHDKDTGSDDFRPRADLATIIRWLPRRGSEMRYPGAWDRSHASINPTICKKQNLVIKNECEITGHMPLNESVGDEAPVKVRGTSYAS